MADQNAAPWISTYHPAEVAACIAPTRFSMSRGAWADPTLAALLAPPVTVTVTRFTARGAEAVVLLRQPGRHRAPSGPFEPPGRAAADVPRWRQLDRTPTQV